MDRQRLDGQGHQNEDEDGWAVAMTRHGESEPALVGPWTMGRDKKNPKPLDVNAFNTLVKTAGEVRRRAEQHQHAMLHKSVTVNAGGETITIEFNIVPDEYEPYAVLLVNDVLGEQLTGVKIRRDFKLTIAWA